METLNVDALGAGIAVMLLSAGINLYVSSRLMTVAKKTESIALESDAWHLRTDVYTSAGVVAGLVLIKLTGIVMLDSFVALGVAVIILKAAFDLIRRSFEDLVDRSLPPEEEARIREIINEHCTAVISFHRLRTRRSGPNRFVDLHMVVPRTATLEEAYGIVKHIEADVKGEFPRTRRHHQGAALHRRGLSRLRCPIRLPGVRTPDPPRGAGKRTVTGEVVRGPTSSGRGPGVAVLPLRAP